MEQKLTELLDELRANLQFWLKRPRFAALPEVADGKISQQIIILLSIVRGISYGDASTIFGTEYHRLLKELDPSDNAYVLFCQTEPWDCIAPCVKPHTGSKEDIERSFRLLSERHVELCSRLGIEV